jgi:glycosyltransferase involved in cell wall biosynthesis
MSDMIEHQKNGYLAQPFIPEDLAQGIHQVLADATKYQQLAENSRAKAIAEFNLEQQTQKYLRVFNDLCSKLAL